MGAGYLKEELNSSLSNEIVASPEQIKTWRVSESKMYREIARFCAERIKQWDKTLAPLMSALDASTYAASIAKVQYETDRRLLLRCSEFMEARAALLAPKEEVKRPSVVDTAKTLRELLDHGKQF